MDLNVAWAAYTACNIRKKLKLLNGVVFTMGANYNGRTKRLKRRLTCVSNEGRLVSDFLATDVC